MPELPLIERILRSLQKHASSNRDKVAIVEAFNPERYLTYQQLHDQALAFASFLVFRGFKMGDRITVALKNSIEIPVIHLGAWAAGGSLVGSSTEFKLYETVYQLQDSASSVVVTSEDMLSTMVNAAKECPLVKLIVCIRSSDQDLPDGVIDFMETFTHKPLTKKCPVTSDMECMIRYSSGTTGLPKGVIHSHRTFQCHIDILLSHWTDNIYPALGVGEEKWFEETQIIASSCLHLFGFTLLNWFIITGSPIVLMKTFDGIIYRDAVEKFKPLFLIITPPMFAYFAKDPIGKEATLSSVKMIMCTTAPLSKQLSDSFFESRRNIRYIVQGYGMTEVNFSHLPLLLKEGANSSGGVLASTFQQKILDAETLQSCMQGQRGEVCVRGPAQTIGYLNKPDATKAPIDDDGWFYIKIYFLGDIGYVDELGFLYIVDRMKDIIKVNFMNQNLQVSPAEIEGILISHTKIKDAAIIGIPNGDGGELVRAYIVKADRITEQEVTEIIADKLAAFKHITGGVMFVDSIPRSAAGKILRRILRE